MTDWKTYKLGNLIEVKHGFAFKGEFFSDEPTNDILLTPGNFKIGGGFKTDKFKFYNGDYPDDYVLKEGDIIITMTDLSKAGDTLGYSAKIPSHNGIRYLHNQRLGLVKFKSNEIDENFLYWILRTQQYQYYIVGSATGSTVRHTSPTRIYNYEFEAPQDIKVQRSIASILSSLDNKIELNLQMNQTLEAMAQAIFKEWFVEFNFPGFDGELVDGLPKGWRKGTLDEIIVVKGGTTPSTTKAEFWDGENYWTTPRDLSNLRSPVLLNTERKITEEGVKQISSGILPKGTLLLSSRAPIGYLAISQIPVSINQGYIAIQGKSVSNIFMLFWLNQNMNAVKGRANGSTFQEINKSNFRQIEVIIPEPGVLKQFDNIANPIFERIVANEIENQSLTQSRDTLLPKLMSGKIEIKV